MATSKSPPSSQPSATDKDLLALQQLPKEALYRLLVAQMGKQKLGLNWESNAIERDAAQNMDVVLPRMIPALCHTPPEMQAKWGDTSHYKNLIIEGDNYDSLRLLRSTHTGKVRVIYIDPPYNTGNKDWSTTTDS